MSSLGINGWADEVLEEKARRWWVKFGSPNIIPCIATSKLGANWYAIFSWRGRHIYHRQGKYVSESSLDRDLAKA